MLPLETGRWRELKFMSLKGKLLNDSFPERKRKKEMMLNLGLWV